jgi:hypothetical protein
MPVSVCKLDGVYETSLGPVIFLEPMTADQIQELQEPTEETDQVRRLLVRHDFIGKE